MLNGSRVFHERKRSADEVQDEPKPKREKHEDDHLTEQRTDWLADAASAWLTVPVKGLKSLALYTAFLF